MTLAGYFTKLKKIYHDNCDEFRSRFGIPLSKYWDLVAYLGFDIVGFDEKFLKTPDGISTRAYVKEKYGEDAVKLLERLIESEKQEIK